MIAGIGTDIVAIARIARAIERHGDRFSAKVLAEAEQAVAPVGTQRAAYVAKRFAAKEAFFKAFGQPSSEANTWHQLAVLNDASGRPQMHFGAALGALLGAQGIAHWHVSLSDEHDYALAYVVLEKE
ncbi:MAG: holo-ACP synthase [Betaproteobacteria bacterium]|nr:holo-ACP synthase [Betaproteobacteria bacterium]